jgi:hypothetical protein
MATNMVTERLRIVKGPQHGAAIAASLGRVVACLDFSRSPEAGLLSNSFCLVKQRLGMAVGPYVSPLSRRLSPGTRSGPKISEKASELVHAGMISLPLLSQFSPHVSLRYHAGPADVRQPARPGSPRWRKRRGIGPARGPIFANAVSGPRRAALGAGDSGSK